MTSPSSYQFYEESNPTQERKVGTQFNRVVVTDWEVTVTRTELMQKGKSGFLSEFLISQHSYSLHENSHGQKYIKRFDKVGANFSDTSLVITRHSAAHWVTSDFLHKDCQILVERTILGWFGYEYEDGDFRRLKNNLLFPAFNDADAPATWSLDNVLNDLDTLNFPVIQSLRESASWEEFLFRLCPSIETKADLQLFIADESLLTTTAIQNHKSLLPIAVLDLGRPLSAFVEKELKELGEVRESLTRGDYRLLAFMLKYIPKSQQAIAVETLINAISQFLKLTPRRYSSSISRFPDIYHSWDITRIPNERRTELAELILAGFKKDCAQLEETLASKKKEARVPFSLVEVLGSWYAREILEPQLVTQLTIEDLDNRFFELFNVSFQSARTSFLSFAHFNDSVAACLDFDALDNTSEYQPELFPCLNSMVQDNYPIDKGIDSKRSIYSGFLNNEGEFCPLSGQIYSLDDILTIIELGAEEADKELHRLGRAITPENRVAFLTFGSEDRYHQETWKLYDWGVTDSERIIELKDSGITDKEEVLAYNALPDDMFYELLALHSGGNHLLEGTMSSGRFPRRTNDLKNW